MSPMAAAERVEAIREGASLRPSISVAELARGRDWRSELPECEIMEINDSGVRVGWLVSDVGVDSLLQTIADLEEQLEQAQVASMLDARRNDDWASGEELRDAALASLDRRGERLREIVDGR